jgi:hypothetical protein
MNVGFWICPDLWIHVDNCRIRHRTVASEWQIGSNLAREPASFD